ncbi:hypothetical protein UT300005_05750 [Clostridium sp. CTA-5]
MAEQTKKKMQVLGKITANPTAKLKDDASSKIDKLNSKITKFKSTNMNATAKINDQASSKIDNLKKKTDKLNNSNAKIKIKAEDEASKTLTNMQNKVNGWIKTGAKKIISIGLAGTVALGGIGIGSSIKTFSNFEKGLSNVKAVTSATNAEMKTLKDTAKDLGASTEWSAVQVTQAEELLGQAGFSVQETTSALPGLLSLASAGDLDLATATDIASGTLRAFNIEASQTGHVADVLALSASATNSDVTDLGETMKYAAPVAQSLGISLEDTAAAAGLLSNANIKGSQAGTVLRASLARLASPTKEAAGLMKYYGINAFDTQGNMKSLSDVVGNLNSSLGSLTSQKRADVISTIFGTEAMSGVLALMNQGGKGLGDLSKELKEANGASKEMADTKLDNLVGQWTILKSAVEGAQIELGERLAPYAKQFVTWLTNKMPDITNGIVKFVDYISKHTEKLKTLATSVIGLGVAFTGFSAVGKFSNTITSVSGLVKILKGAKVSGETTAIAGGLKNIGLMGKLLPAVLSPTGLAIGTAVITAGVAVSNYKKLMNRTVTTTTEELGTVEKIMNSLTGNVIKSKRELRNAGLIYDDFGEGVSDSFKTAAKDASKSLLKMEMDIKKLTRNGSMDESHINQFKNYINDFTYEGINAIKAKQSEVKSELSKTFSLDGVTSAEQGTLDYMDKFFGEGVNKELQIRDEMYKIGDAAIKDHGAILDGDMQQIKEKLAELQAIRLEYANAENAGEQAYARSKFTSAAERVTGIDGASELLQERVKGHQSSIDEIKGKYDRAITATQYHLDNDKNLTDTDKTNLQNTINENKVARDKALEQAKEDWQSDLETLYNAFPDAKGKLNEKTGEKFSYEDIKRNQTLGVMTNSKFAGLANVKESGMYSLINNETGKFESVYAEVDKATGEVIGAYAQCSGQVGGYTAEMADNAKKSALEISNSNSHIISTLDTVKSASVNAAGEMIGDGNRLIAQLGEVQTAQDGTLYRIMNINGTPINVQVDSSGAITNLDEVRIKAEEASRGRSIEITSSANEVTEEVNNTTNAINSIPADTPANIRTNAGEAKGIVDELLGSLKGLGGKIWTATINISKKIFGAGDISNEEIAKNIDHHADGTSFSNAGLTTVNERGLELTESKSVPILGRYNGEQLAYTNRGTKILNHMQSVQDMKEEVSRQVDFKISKQQVPQQIQYQIVKPQQQLQVAGIGGVSFGDINLNIDGKQDVDEIIAQATKEVARKLKEAFTNIKK